MPISDYPDCDGVPKVDKIGESVEINVSTGLVRIDGVPVFRVVLDGSDGIRLQFADNDKMRSRFRGTRYIEIPASVLFEKLSISCT